MRACRLQSEIIETRKKKKTIERRETWPYDDDQIQHVAEPETIK